MHKARCGSPIFQVTEMKSGTFSRVPVDSQGATADYRQSRLRVSFNHGVASSKITTDIVLRHRTNRFNRERTKA
jgi:hypothetical protein